MGKFFRMLAERGLGHQELRRSPELKLIIFDFDGTIADTFETGFRIFNELAEELGCRRVDASELPLLRSMRTREFLRYMKVPLSRMELISRRGCDELRARIDSVQPFPGAPHTLRELRVRGYRLGIITSNTGANVSRFLRNHDLKMFEFVRSSSKIFGKAREIRRVLREYNLDRTEILVVGDETRDIEAAKAAGVAIASAAWGYAARAKLESMEPNFLMDEFGELLLVLDRVSGRWGGYGKRSR